MPLVYCYDDSSAGNDLESGSAFTVATGAGNGGWDGSQGHFPGSSYGYDDGVTVYGFRFYSPGQGRFLNRDPMGEQGGLNLYAFVGNDPVNRWDYLGLSDFIGFPGIISPPPGVDYSEDPP